MKKVEVKVEGGRILEVDNCDGGDAARIPARRGTRSEAPTSFADSRW